PDPEHDRKSLLGAMEVIANGVCVALVPLAMQVGGKSWSDDDGPWDASTGSLFEEAFASYFRDDRQIVDACRAACKALGMHFFVDGEVLLARQEWLPDLLQKIEQADAFELFWSTSSNKSHNVENEWRHALTLRGQKGHRFLRPLYWQEPKPDAPEELDQLNFSFLNLDTLANSNSSEFQSSSNTENSSKSREAA